MKTALLVLGCGLFVSGSAAAMHRPAAEPPRPDGTRSCHASYLGGPLLQHVEIVTVYWGGVHPLATQLDAFYAAITNGPFMDWLAEYNTTTPAFSIGRGTFASRYVDSDPPPAAPLTGGALSRQYQQVDIQNELARLLDAGKLVAHDDTLFMVYMPPGVEIKDRFGSDSCLNMCAFHDSFAHNGKTIRFGVMPDQTGGPCACPIVLQDALGTYTVLSSHEMVEAITDPDPGTGWYDPTVGCGEIADFCEGDFTHRLVPAKVGDSWVQSTWSNDHAACIVAPNDFAVSLAPDEVHVVGGSPFRATLGSAVLAGSPSPLTLSAPLLPTGFGASFAPDVIAPGDSSTVTVQTSKPSNAFDSVENYAISVTSAEGITHLGFGVAVVQAPSAGDMPADDMGGIGDMAVAEPTDLAAAPIAAAGPGSTRSKGGCSCSFAAAEPASPIGGMVLAGLALLRLRRLRRRAR
jgi:MYXO-CTERM domain-containing protein